MNAIAIDKEALKKKYAEERDKRLRGDGAVQYVRLESEFSDLATDPYTPLKERDPVTDDVTFAFIGGGFAGLVVGARLTEAGIDDARIIARGLAAISGSMSMHFSIPKSRIRNGMQRRKSG